VVEEAKIVVVSSDEKAIIPAGYYYTFINTGDMTVVFARVVMQEHIVNYQALQRQNGMAYYLISKNARPELVSNPRYRDIVEVQQVASEEINERYGFKDDKQVPLYDQVIGNFNLFANLLAVA
jgi:oxalate decarboxylase/phosphoglucose isomerase-like protein (cupin superfamily)